jgi:polyisoprenoid-binding protein YceI
MHKLLVAAFAATLGSAALAADLSEMPAGRYSVEDSHAYITFSYTHLGFSRPQLRFNDFTVDLDLDPERPEDSELSVVIDATSIDTGVAIFDEHMMERENLLHAQAYPEITFDATRIELQEPDRARITGDLTVKGITRSVTLDVVLRGAGNHPMMNVPTLGFVGTTTIRRSDWGLDYAVPAVSDEVDVTISTELVKAD